MSEPKKPAPAKLICSAIYAASRPEHSVEEKLIELFGEIDYRGERQEFSHTHYYRREMGDRLHRRTYTFAKLIERDKLAWAKLRTNEIELDFTEGESRTVNLDPGLLTAENLILATGKNFTHRIYLGEGIFGDLTLFFKGGEYQTLPWTYPDYGTAEYRALLLELRKSYFEQLRPGEDD